MVGGIEGLGEAVTGGMIAAVAEPSAGRSGAARHGGHCLNCDAPLTGEFCSSCGQRAHVHRTISAFWHDLAHSVLHFDGKIWRTLPMLAWWPGDLTRRYVEGERARFVSPMALFLFSVFLMFAVFSTLGGPVSLGADPVDRAEAAEDIGRERTEMRETLGKLGAERARLQRTRSPTTAVDLSIAQLERNLAILDATAKVVASGTQEQVEDAMAEDLPDLTKKDFRFETGWERLDKGIRKASENPSLFFYKVQTNAYKFSWALIPISVPFLWLLFLHRRRYREYGVYDHTVFVTYSIAFMSLSAIALSLLRPLGLSEGVSALIVMLVPPIHMYRQLRGAYRLSRFSALWRTAALLVLCQVAISLFLTLLLALGALG